MPKGLSISASMKDSPVGGDDLLNLSQIAFFALVLPLQYLETPSEADQRLRVHPTSSHVDMVAQESDHIPRCGDFRLSIVQLFRSKKAILRQQ